MYPLRCTPPLGDLVVRCMPIQGSWAGVALPCCAAAAKAEEAAAVVSDDVTTAGVFKTSRQFRNCRWSIALSVRRNTTPALLQAASASRHESP